ncbi:MAG TPA: response regulator transcription factor [Chloroflexota bacterium]|nr:response regulator transcription factor [Chloroflexota bacterium]
MIHTEPSLMRNEDAVQTSRQTILLVDDDAGVSSLVAEILEGEGYGVETVSTGAEAEAAVERLKPDLVLLDIILPDADGLMLCNRLLQQWRAPVIMLSGSRRESDRILSLRLGADDFIAKPFDTFELVARVQAALRRAPREAGVPPTSPLAPAASWTIRPQPGPSHGARLAGQPEMPIEIGPLTIDPRRRTVTVGGQPVHLTPTENRLLTALASEPERVFSRDELAGVLWGYDSLGESRAVDVHIRRLRAKLEPFGDEAPPIVTVRGFGYKLGEIGAEYEA